MSITYEYSPLLSAAWFAILAMMTVIFLLKPRKVVFPYFLTILVFTGTQYGLVEGGATTIYSRGVGVFTVSLISIFLYIIFAIVFFRYGLQYKKINEPSIQNKSLSFLIIFITLFYLYGIVTNITFDNIVSPRGMVNFINLYLFYLILKWSVFDEKQLDSLVKVFIYATSFMAIYGVIRWGLFRGDPANYYLNFGGQSMKITYFDGGQGNLFGILIVLLYHKTRLMLVRGRAWWFYNFMIGLCLMNILFSYRRSVWFGVSLIFIWIFFTSNASRKVLILGIAFVALAVGSGIYQQRYDKSHKTQSIVSDITDKSGNVDVKHGRFSEITGALEIANKYWVIGMGPWGINSPRVTPQKDTDFVHSSIIHVYIKTGIIGVMAYLSMYFGYIIWWIKQRNKKWHNNYYRSIGDAFFCGFLMEISDIIFGTPLIIFRHTQIIAMLLVMPYVCYRIDQMTTDKSTISKSQKNKLLLSR